MPADAILVEKDGRGWGVALGPQGRFIRVKVPDGIELGDTLPYRSSGLRNKATLAAAAALMLLGVSGYFLIAGQQHMPAKRSAYSLVTLRFVPAQQQRGERNHAGDDLVLIEAEKDLSMTLSVDQHGNVTAVNPRQPKRIVLVGLRVEDAVGRTIRTMSEDYAAGIELRGGSAEAAADLRARIKKALPANQVSIIQAEAETSTEAAVDQQEQEAQADGDEQSADNVAPVE